MFNQVNNSARAFTRTFENPVFRLVRSEAQFKKFAEAEGIELSSKRGNHEGELKKRVAIWSAKAEHGIIANKRDADKFMRLCEEVEEEKAPAKRGRKPKEENESENGGPKKRGPKALKESSKKTKVVLGDDNETINALDEEPDLEIDVDEDYPVAHNKKEFIKAFKSEFKRLNIDAEPTEVVKALIASNNIRELLVWASKVLV